MEGCRHPMLSLARGRRRGTGASVSVCVPKKKSFCPVAVWPPPSAKDSLEWRPSISKSKSATSPPIDPSVSNQPDPAAASFSFFPRKKKTVARRRVEPVPAIPSASCPCVRGEESGDRPARKESTRTEVSCSHRLRCLGSCLRNRPLPFSVLFLFTDLVPVDSAVQSTWLLNQEIATAMLGQRETFLESSRHTSLTAGVCVFPFLI